MKTRTITLATIALLALTGCGRTNMNPEPGPQEPGIPASYPLDKTFYVEAPNGAEITVDVPVDGPAEVEGARTDFGADEVAYLEVNTDNRKGGTTVDIYNVTLTDEDGKTYEFMSLNGSLVDWNADQDLIDSYYGTDTVSVGQSTESILVGPSELPESVTFVTIKVDAQTVVPLAPKE